MRLAPLALIASLSCATLAAQELPTGRFTFRTVTLELTQDGRYTFSNSSGPIVTGAYRAEGGVIELRDDGGRLACTDGPGRYRWRASADTLRFETISDVCEGRRNVVATGAWAKARGALVLRGGIIVDGMGAPPRRGMSLLLRDGRIAALYADGAQPLPADATVVDLSGAFVLPGLIDAHVHLATSPSGVDRRALVEQRLRMTLLGGVTTVRDMAGDARVLADLARAAAAGDIASPGIRYAAVMAGPMFFGDPRVLASSAGVPPGQAPWARAVTDTSDLRQIVAEARGTGASAIKLYGALDGALAQRLAEEAHRQKLLVWSHAALIPAVPSEVVGAGADIVSHAHLVALEGMPPAALEMRNRLDYDPAIAGDARVARLIATMRERRVILEPTLFVFRAGASGPDTSRARRMAETAFAITRAAHAAGVRIAAGTDGMIGQEAGSVPNLHTELELLVRHGGLTPMQAIVAATRTNAEALGIEETHGSIAPGKVADLLVVTADPTADIRNTRAVRMVVKGGTIVTR